MSIQSNFPAIKPTLLLDFANTKQLDPRITFTRASTATYYGTQTAKAEENLLLQSQTFDNASWIGLGITTTADTSAAPDGTTTADSINELATTEAHRCAQNVTLIVGQTYTVSVFVKPLNGREFQISFGASDVSGNPRANFNLTSGILGDVGSGLTATITASTNGFYRCTTTFVAADSALSVSFCAITTATAARQESYAGDVTKGIILWGAQLEQRSAATAYTVTTTQTITNYVPQLLTAASGVARFDHNPTTFESLGLEIEEQRTNLILQSEAYNVSPWASSSPYSVTANTAIAPDGAQTADALIVESGQSSFANNVTRQVVSKAASAIQYTRSTYFKALGATTSVRLSDFGNLSANSASVIVSLIDGSVITAPSITGSFSGASVAVSNAGNGWWRVAFTYTTDAHTSLTVRSFPYVGATPLTGNGFSGLLAWGAQLEAGAFSTSYIPTVASQVTRAADAASMTGTNFSSWFNQGEGTIYAEGLLSNPAVTGVQTRRFVDINDGTINNKIIFGRAATASDLRVTYTVSGTNVNGTNGQTASNVFPSAKVAVAYEAADYAFSPNGAPVTTSTAANVPVVNRLDIGSNFDNSATASANGTIKKIAYYPMRLVNAQLQALTS
jgi:hypothetical protein